MKKSDCRCEDFNYDDITQLHPPLQYPGPAALKHGCRTSDKTSNQGPYNKTNSEMGDEDSKFRAANAGEQQAECDYEQGGADEEPNWAKHSPAVAD